jgi:DNA-binding transcriptional ArsR family regulator
MELAQVGRVFAALSDPTRREVVRRLSEAGSATVTDLATDLPVTRQAVAKHLSVLREAGLVSVAAEGRSRRYTLTAGPMTDAVGWMAEVGAAWDARLAALQRHLSRGAG